MTHTMIIKQDRSIDVKRNQPLQMCKVVIGSGKKGGALLKRFARTNQIAKA